MTAKDDQMSNSTTYRVVTLTAGGEETEVGTKSKKSTAVDLARETRNAQGVHVKVLTSAGNEVFDLPAPKKIKMSPRYTRVVDLPKGVKVPKGKRVAYDRARKNIAILHDTKAGTYSVWNFMTNEILADELETTRDAGAFCKTVPLPAKETVDA